MFYRDGKPRQKCLCNVQPYHFAAIYLGLTDKENAKELEEHATSCEYCCEVWFKISAIFSGVEPPSLEESLSHIRFVAGPLGDMFSELTIREALERVKDPDLLDNQTTDSSDPDSSDLLPLSMLQTIKPTQSVSLKDVVNAQVVVNIQTTVVTNGESVNQIEVRQRRGISHYMKVAAAVILAFNFFGLIFYTGHRIGQNSPSGVVVKYQEESSSRLVDKAHKETDAAQLAYLFEEASEKINSNSGDSTAFLVRAIVGEKLMLLEQSESDFKSYSALTGIDTEADVKRVQDIANTPPKPTKYDLIDESIDKSLQALISGDYALSKSHLTEAKNLSDSMLKETGDRIGVDLVDYYSKLSSQNQAKELLEARKARKRLAKTATIDNFQQCIKELENNELIFAKYSSKVDSLDNSLWLSRFLIKSYQKQKAKIEVEQALSYAAESGYKLAEAQLVYIKSELAIFDENIAESITLSNKSLKLFSGLDSDILTLYPLMSLVVYQANSADNNLLSFKYGLEGLTKSIKKEEGNTKRAAFAARFSALQAIAAEKMSLFSVTQSYLNYGLTICTQYNLTVYPVELKCLLANLYASQGDRKRALLFLDEAKQLGENFKDSIAKKEITLTISGYEGKVYGMLGNYNKSEASYKEAISIAKGMGTPNVLYSAELDKGLGEALYAQGKARYVEAKQELISAQQKFDKAALRHETKRANLVKYNFSNKSIEELLRKIDAR